MSPKSSHMPIFLDGMPFNKIRLIYDQGKGINPICSSEEHLSDAISSLFNEENKKVSLLTIKGQVS